jgi:hypothetical protein
MRDPDTSTNVRVRLWRAGYQPIPAEGKRPPMKEWQKHLETNEDEIKLWSKSFPYALNTGLLTRATPTIDLDILDKDAAQALELLAADMFGATGKFLTRIGKDPKRAMPFRTDQPFAKKTLEVKAPNGGTEKIEILCDGQQFIAHGTHPDTRGPYRWINGTPWTVPHGELCELTEADACGYMVAAQRLLTEQFGYQVPQKDDRRHKVTDEHGNERKGPVDWTASMANMLAPDPDHEVMTEWAASMIGRDTPPAVARAFIESALQCSPAPHDDRWKRRLLEVEDAVASAVHKYGKQPDQPSPPPLHNYATSALTKIPRRKWMHANHFIRGQVSMTVAPGGYGKSSLDLVNVIEMATGRGLIGPAPAGRFRVLYWNGEDPDDEIERRVAAICIRYEIDPVELHGWLFLGSKLTGKRLADLNEKGQPDINAELCMKVCDYCRERHIDCLVFDPMIAFHSLPETDNGAMEFLIKRVFESFAATLDVAVDLCHHTRKPAPGGGGDLTVDDARGGGAAGNACRSVRVLNRMTAKEAELPKIIGEDRRLYLRVARDKSNMAPPAKACWMHLKDIELPNGELPNGDSNLSIPGDHVQAAEPWTYPQPFEGVATEDMHWMRDTVRAGNYRKDPRSPDWAGLPLLAHLKLNPADKSNRKKAGEIIRLWIGNRVLKVEQRPDEKRRDREFLAPGDWNAVADDSSTAAAG